MKFKFYLGLASLVVLFLGTEASAENTTKSLNKSDYSVEALELRKSYSKISLYSNILQEQREVWVHLPENYENTQKYYPVLYLLDGARHFHHALNAEQVLHQESLIPSSIIVAIPNKRGKRTRDLSLEKDNFLNFIEKDVVSLITARYRTLDQSTIFGHSMAGYFVLNALVSKPQLFTNIIAASPVIQNNNAELIKKYQTDQFLNQSSQKSLYLTLTNEINEGEEATNALNEFVSLMKKNKPANLNWHYQYIPNQVHMTTPYLTLYQGLVHAYDDYRMPSYSGLSDYKKRGGYQQLAEFYRKRASKYATSNEIPERAMRRLGFALIDEGHIKEAIKILKPNVEKHPKSIGALNALAEAYESTQPNKAIKVYKRSLLLAKERSRSAQNYIGRQIKRLESQLDN